MWYLTSDPVLLGLNRIFFVVEPRIDTRRSRRTPKEARAAQGAAGNVLRAPRSVGSHLWLNY